jgi:hypothetical protein
LRKYNVKWYGILPKKCIELDGYIILKFDIFFSAIMFVSVVKKTTAW